jgi:dTDP-4-amino-4,6-dideoxygalactose transaminase
MQALLERGIATRRGVMCAHREPAYPRGTWRCVGQPSCDCAAGECHALAVSEAAQDRMLVIPLYPQMTDAQQDRVVDTLREVLGA